MAQENLQAPEPINLSDKEIAKLSDAQFKTLVIRMLTELVDFSHKLEEHMKAKLIEMKGDVQESNSDEKETDSNQWNGPEGRTKHPTRKE